MHKLFALKNNKTGKLLPNIFFGDKSKAKAERDEVNKLVTDGEIFVVTYGPDHDKFRKH